MHVCLMRNSNSRKFGCEDFLAEVGTFISKRDLPKRAQKESQVLLSTKIAISIIYEVRSKNYGNFRFVKNIFIHSSILMLRPSK